MFFRKINYFLFFLIFSMFFLYLQNAQIGNSGEIPIDVMTYGGLIQFFSFCGFIVCIVIEIIIVVIENFIVGIKEGINPINGRGIVIDSIILCTILIILIIERRGSPYHFMISNQILYIICKHISLPGIIASGCFLAILYRVGTKNKSI